MRRSLPISSPAAETPEPEPPKPFFDSRFELEGHSTVVLLGVSGAGKSTMGNLLVFGDPYYHEGFDIGHGTDSRTTNCEPRTYLSEKVRLTIYNSPGVPDTNSAMTFDMFDEIAAKIRELTSLNAIVFLIKSHRQEEGDYGVFRTLLKQFARLPCSIVMVCRVDTTDCEHRREVRVGKEREAHELMDRVIDRSQLGRDRVLKFLLHHGDLGFRDASTLRWFFCMMPGLAVTRETLLTTGEVEARYKALGSEQTRIEELRQERDDLVNSLEKLDEERFELQTRIETWQFRQTGLKFLSQIAGGAQVIPAVSDVLYGALCGAKVVGDVGQTLSEAQIAGWKAALEIAINIRARLDAEKDLKTEEINSGRVDQLKLKAAREEWEELTKLLER